MACTPASMAFGGVANGLSPISSSMTSLPAAMSRLAMASTLKALSTPTEEANWLNAGIRNGMISRDLTAGNMFIICEHMRDVRSRFWRCCCWPARLPFARNRPSRTAPRSRPRPSAPNASGETRRQIEVLPGGRFNAINMTLWQIISIAYPIDGKFRDAINLTGGPGWIDSDRFDIVAKAEGSPQLDTNKPGSTVTDVDRDAVERIRMMLRRFLAERFKLRLHHETRQLPIYELVIAKDGGALEAGISRRPPAECGRECGSIRADGSGQSRRHGGIDGLRRSHDVRLGSAYRSSIKPGIDRADGFHAHVVA